MPGPLEGKTLAETGIGARTGLNVIAAQHNGQIRTNLTADTRLERGMELLMLGDVEQRHKFTEEFGGAS